MRSTARTDRRSGPFSMPALVLLAGLLASPAAAQEVVFDRVVAVVDDEPVLASDLRLEELLTGLDPSPSPFWRRDRGTSRQRVVEATMLRLLAGRVTLYDPETEAIEARLQAIRARLGGDRPYRDLLAYWGLDEVALAARIRRRMVVERYLERNLPVDPVDEAAWTAALDSLLASVRERFRIRDVPGDSAAPGDDRAPE